MSHNSNWEIKENSNNIQWHFKPEEGSIQGPLDLCLFQGKSVNIQLNEGQVALLSVGGELKKVIFSGSHQFFVDNNSLPETGLIHMLDLSKEINCSFYNLTIPMESPINISGHLNYFISNPALFYNTFLRNCSGNEQECNKALSNLLSSIFRIYLTQLCGASAEKTEYTNSLHNIDSDNLEEHLEHYGISCSTVHVQKPTSVDRESHLLVTEPVLA